MTFRIATENIKLKYFLWKEKGKSSFSLGGPYAFLCLLILSPDFIKTLSKDHKKSWVEFL